METLLASVSLENGGEDFIFTGVNVHIRDGTGDTDGVTNGLGNLIVGYNEDSTGGEIRSSFAGLVAGYNNYISGWYASVSGGSANTDSGDYSSVSGGFLNTANGVYASVSGGSQNNAAGDDSSVSGGLANDANGLYSSIYGGYNQTVTTTYGYGP